MRSTIVLSLALIGCSAAVAEEPDTAEEELTSYGVSDGDPTQAPRITSTEQRRVTHHGGPVLRAMRVQAVYIGLAHEGGVGSRDDVIEWTLGSGAKYWGVLDQYGVGPGLLAGTIRVPKSALGATSETEFVPIDELESRISALLRPKDGRSVIPAADAYAIFLPQGLGVSLGNRGTKVFRTCVDVGAYHRHDGVVPYAVFPACELGYSARAISHELAEMATDPVVGTGWFSDGDVEDGIGEIADLCNRSVSTPIQGYAVTELWSNRDARCMPVPR